MIYLYFFGFSSEGVNRARYGVWGKVLEWFKSYMIGRTQTVSISGTTSTASHLTCGVPQGSVLGPVLFTTYMAPLADIIRQHGLNYMFYADDSQIYFTATSSSPDDIHNSAQKCIRHIRDWMLVNRLKLNDDKTEVINFSSCFRPSPCTPINFQFGDSTVLPTSSVRNLGVYMDSELRMVGHINSVVKSVFYQIHIIGKIRRNLDQQSTKKLVHALVTSRLDYCNSLLVGLPATLTGKLQRAQNCAARLVTLTPRRDHISPVLYKLHWLPIKYRCEFKVLALVFKCIQNQAPEYLCDLIKISTNIKSPRLSHLSLQTKRTKTTTYGSRAFCVIGPQLWNALPLDLRESKSLAVFKISLKSHMFKLAFNV